MKVLVFGSLNIDYVYSVNHFVQPGETLSADDRQIFSGGKGLNQAIAFAKYGLETWHAGAVGAEDSAPPLETRKDAGVHTDLVLKKEGSSGHTIIQNTPEGENCIILFGGANQAITKADVDHILTFAEPGDYLVLQNEISEIPYLMNCAYEKGMHIVLNPSPVNAKIFQMPLEKAEYLILNEIEAAAILKETGAALAENADGTALLNGLVHKFPDSKIVLTLGKEGSMYGYHTNRCAPSIKCRATLRKLIAAFLRDEKYSQSAATVKPSRTITTQEIINGKTPEEALKTAAMASAIAVGKKGASTSIPTLAEVRDSL